MSRACFSPPPHYPFFCEMTVPVHLLNYGNHLGNDALLACLHEARLLFLQQRGLSELGTEGVSLIMTECHIYYKAQGFWGDKMKIEVACQISGKLRLQFFYRVSKSPDTVMAEALTVLTCFDYQMQRVVKTPSHYEIILGNNPPLL